MKFLPLVLFLSTFGATYGGKEDAVEAECSKHDNGLREAEDDEAPGSTIDAFANDVMGKTVIKEIDLPGPNEKPPEEDEKTTIGRAEWLAEVMFHRMQSVAKVAKDSPFISNATLVALRYICRYTMDSGKHWIGNTSVKNYTALQSTVQWAVDNSTQIAKSLSLLIDDADAQKETLSAFADMDWEVAKQTVKDVLNKKAQEAIDYSDKAQMFLNLIISMSEAASKVGLADWTENILSAKTAKIVGKVLGGLSYIADWWGHHDSPDAALDETKTKEIEKNIKENPDNHPDDNLPDKDD
jgi:hypothetical protein